MTTKVPKTYSYSKMQMVSIIDQDLKFNLQFHLSPTKWRIE